MVDLILTSFCASAAGQNKKGPTRISFKKGESSTIVKGQVSTKRLERAFLVGARTGQELYLEVREGRGDAKVLLIDPSGKPIASDGLGEGIRVRLKQSGVYRIEVSPPGRYYRNETYEQLLFAFFISIK
jgi:hypothetical protein